MCVYMFQFECTWRRFCALILQRIGESHKYIYRCVCVACMLSFCRCISQTKYRDVDTVASVLVFVGPYSQIELFFQLSPVQSFHFLLLLCSIYVNIYMCVRVLCFLFVAFRRTILLSLFFSVIPRLN